MPITTIVFDLGGVLIDWNPRYLYRKIFATEAQVDHFIENICTMAWNEQQDAGRTWAEANEVLIAQHPAYQSEIEAYFGRWPEMLGGAIGETVKILEHFHQSKTYRLYALTNWSAETFPVAKKRFAFLKYFEDILVSGEVKLKKPDQRIYQLLFERFDIIPEEAIFIDDSAKNIKAAAEVGMQVIHFQDGPSLSASLRKMAVL
ncbi:MAG: HAD family phosphatase [Bacteroidota bacterium]